MNPMLYVRTRVLDITQAQMAALTGVQQGTVSRWEKRTLEPDRSQLDRIRAEVARLRKEWNDAWFFTAPVASPSEEVRQESAP